MNLAPVIVFAYDRPDHLKQTLDALAANTLAKESVLYIFCDAAKLDASEEQKLRIRKVREIAKTISGFRELYVVCAEKNKGLADSIIDGVTEIVNKFGRAIVLEDDLVTSPYFLQFMNDALEIYKDEDQVMHISAFMWPHGCRLPETFLCDVPNSWGWATWDRAWKYFNNDADYLYHMFEHRWEEFDKLGGGMLKNQLVSNYNGTLKTWYIKWYAMILLRNGLALYPGQSLIENIGMDGTGTNCSPSKSFANSQLAGYISVKKQPLIINKRAVREMYAFYQGRWYNKRRRTQMLNTILRFFHVK